MKQFGTLVEQEIRPGTRSIGIASLELLGLGHANEGNAECVSNNSVCYATDNVMGGGETINSSNARPWQNAMQAVTGITSSQWRVSLAEVLPVVR